MKKIGITGGIGSGKSTISQIFKSLGVGVYNSDQISKNILFENSEIQKKIIYLFGKEI